MPSRLVAHAPFALLVLLMAIAVAPPLRAHDDPSHHAASEEMRQAAAEFVDALSPEQREAVVFTFDGGERTDWNFVPMDRVGVTLKAMTLEQRRAARKLMRSTLSDQGYLKATTIMSLEEVLRVMESRRQDVNEFRDPEKYYFAVFGNPAGNPAGDSADEAPWGWRVEGHHLSLNFTSDGGLEVAGAPLFFGANPHEVRIGPKMGLRALGAEEDAARELMGMFTDEQRAKVIFARSAPREILTAPGKPIDLAKPEGLALSQMTPEQQRQLKALIKGFVANLRPELAEHELSEIENAGYNPVTFGWAGGLGPDDRHYFRVHGPTFVIEYDNAQGNHTHMVWHSAKDDFGLDMLQKHYAEDHEHADEAEHALAP